ncbi:E3 ubiquitin-protein ligase RNF166-like [Ptychodera flava]|uniref:E3 ubiquitin-protein ligase RNF166-like n=1 Tax=Ptychodera flava TaxID=63121 RepID=UPI00396A749C
MASGGKGVKLVASPSPAAEDSFICSICLEVYHRPVTVQCGHTFCAECLNPHVEDCKESKATPHCPVCRKPFDSVSKERNHGIDEQMRAMRTVCKACGMKVRYSKLRAHNSECLKVKDPPIHKFAPVAPTSQVYPADQPNRSTFHCPYCDMLNLDASGLLKHCNEKHKGAREPAVCPICASMPWGNPNQQSGNFIQHLNIRHRFEYETYVDYEADDDAMLQAAIKASLKDSM